MHLRGVIVGGKRGVCGPRIPPSLSFGAFFDFHATVWSRAPAAYQGNTSNPLEAHGWVLIWMPMREGGTGGEWKKVVVGDRVCGSKWLLIDGKWGGGTGPAILDD